MAGADDDPATTQVEAIRRYVNNHAVETAGAANFTTTLRRPDLSAARLRPPHGCHPARCADRRQPAERPDPQAGQRLAGAPHPGVGATPRKMSSCCWRWTATSTPTKRRRPTLWPASGWERPTPAASSSRGARTDRHQTDVPMNYLVDRDSAGGGTQDLILSKDGAGRLVLPPGAALCAHRPETGTAGYGLCGPAQLRGGGQSRRMSAQDRMASGISRPGRGCACT